VDKRVKYAPVVYTAELHRYIRGGGVKRKGLTIFAPAMSHSVEMSSDMFKLVEWRPPAEQSSSRVPKGPRGCGSGYSGADHRPHDCCDRTLLLGSYELH
jgi:hypothetical protein